MKKTFIMIAAMSLLAACGGGEKKEEAKKEETPVVTDITTNPDYQKGVEIVAASDCFTCHKIDEKNIGPAWRDVAVKYAGKM
jgi:cytochrome c